MAALNRYNDILIPRACECDFIWEKVFADILKNFQIKSSWVFIQEGSKSIDMYLYKRHTEDRHSQKVRGGCGGCSLVVYSPCLAHVRY